MGSRWGPSPPPHRLAGRNGGRGMARGRKRDEKVENTFETVLFNARFLALFAVLGILIASFVMFVKGCIEIVQGVRAFWATLLGMRPTAADDNSVILSFIPAIDNYLFATILLIIS